MADVSTRRSGIDLFRVGRVQITVDFSWIVIFLLVLWSLSAGYFPAGYPGYGAVHYLIVGLAGTLLFFASVLIHELSHAFVGNALGQDVRRITLFIFGGMAHLSGEPRDAAAEAKIAGVGPLTSFALGGLFLLVANLLVGVGAPELWEALFRYLGIVNIALAVFNLLPGFPLDGGRLLRAFFWSRTGDLRQATRRAADWGSGIAIGLMVLGALQIFAGALVGGLWLIFIAMFLRMAARASLDSVIVGQALQGMSVRELMIGEPVRIPPDASVERAVQDYFLDRGFGGFPVGRDGGDPEGLLSLSQVRECPAGERGTRQVRDVMRPRDAVIEIDARANVSDALQRMAEGSTGRLLVYDRGRFVGMITRDAITRYLQLRSEGQSE